MKKIMVLMALVFIFASTPVGATYVPEGEVDTIINYALLENSGEAENAWLEGLGFVAVEEYEGSELNWKNLEGTIWAAELKGTPTNFFIKIGTGGTTILYDHFMYQNNLALNYAVIDLKDWYVNTMIPTEFPNNVNVERVSHIGEGNTSVPEPTTILLLGFGMISLAGVGRKFKK